MASINKRYAKHQFIVLEDALAANSPHIQALTHYGMDFIINIKPGSNASLFEDMHQRFLVGDVSEAKEQLADGTIRGSRVSFRFGDALESLSQRATHEYWEVIKKGKTTNFSWITNLALSSKTVYVIAKAGRTRWRIENETFNTLKNQGYHFEHNYGHRKQYLSSTLAGLMLLAFLTDQRQNHACQLFKAARKQRRVQTKMWEFIRTILQMIELPDWKTLWRLIAKPGSQKGMVVIVDSSRHKN